MWRPSFVKNFCIVILLYCISSETSRNRVRRFPASFKQVSSKQTKSLVIPAGSELYTVKSIRGLELPVLLPIYQKPARNLSETSAAGFQRFPKVSGESIINGPHGIYLSILKGWKNLKGVVLNLNYSLFVNSPEIYIQSAPNNSNETHTFYVSGQSRPFWAALKLL